MSRIESPDAQLVALLRRSDSPSVEDARRVRDAIGLSLALKGGASTALLAGTRTSWAAHLGMLGTWGKGLLLVSALVGVGIGVTWYAKSSTQCDQEGRSLRESAEQDGRAIVSPFNCLNRNQSTSD